MKIGIFGDSYSSSTKLNYTSSWVDILSVKYNITNYSIPGSNLYFSVDYLLKNFNKYDRCVLVVTNPGRISLPDFIDVDDPKQKFIAGPRSLDQLQNNNVSPLLKNAYNAADLYFQFLQNFEYDDYVHGLMVKDAVCTVPNLIVIPGAPNVSGENSMYDIYLKETLAWGEDSETVSDFYDKRNCHMTYENNVIFSEKVESWLDGKPVIIDIDDFVTTSNKEFYLT